MSDGNVRLVAVPLGRSIRESSDEGSDMNREEKKLMRLMQELGAYQKTKERKKAAQVRNAMVKKGSGRPGKFDGRRWEDARDTAPSYQKQRRLPSLDEIAKSLETRPASEQAVDESLETATVISVTRRFCSVISGDKLFECFLSAKLASVQQSEIAPGDRVRFEVKDDGSRMIHSVQPRTTFLARPDPHNARRQRVIAANIDTVVNVVSVKNPPLRPRLIDRYLIAITEGGAKPLICVNKVDLIGESELVEELRCLDAYRDLGVETVLCSTRDGRGLDELRARLRGGLAVFVGHSGVGKSTILKRLVHTVEGADIDLDGIRTADVSHHGTGRHTTRLATLYELGEGTAIVDTPGIREFGLWNLDDETLRSYFPEFEELAVSCKFNDCSHSHEPNCAVRDAARDGRISAARLDTYLRIREELREQGELK